MELVVEFKSLSVLTSEWRTYHHPPLEHEPCPQGSSEGNAYVEQLHLPTLTPPQEASTSSLDIAQLACYLAATIDYP